jgi:hypothetical protein
VAAEPKKFTSGTGRTHLIELYTSEGCSSCPPAEKWLGELRAHPGLWRDFVPVAFHVNYWDKLGWPDRFASREFTQREYALAAAWNSESVYTPCFALDGGEWRMRDSHEIPAAGANSAGVLTVEYENDGTLRIAFAPSTHGEYTVQAAILGGGIVSAVRAGENEGRTLHHDFIALALKTAPLRNGRAELTLRVPAVADVPHHALAVWVTRTGELTPVQATGGWLD